ncbi:tetratricopeptide (TPR) repeat protein [Pseudomonas sp. BIGb0408]|uniref:Tetratricopeptide (TPR) repeat protein n=1 Tax=Phytopseudomonas flavescens TaxID=29435 RepID=A0A7Z0BSX7_9GAMM|nr:MULTISPECIES: tetratricopeptide repeat protein [Pseudomonas]MCW2295075.1 tetratricopeptide (TPR) repeat protein [Pseudomonas sp. BIGb0408]NYH75651.1 tetratricopeptide (TPR) repeat protein [Pseudomonas flavescens]
MKRTLLSFALLPLFSVAAHAAPQPCDSVSLCNSAGTAAYQAGRYDEAADAFERQLRRAEQADDAAARELALNNLVVTSLRLQQPGQARAWLNLALDDGMQGTATRHNLRSVSAALNYQALGASLEGRYLRYAGAAVWSSLDITRQPDGSYRASFSPLRAGGKVEEYGPAAIGNLQGALQGEKAYFLLTAADLPRGCAVELFHEGLDMRVLEVFDPQCQQYGGAGISVAGDYLKVSAEPQQQER